MQRVPAFALELKEVGVAGQSDGGIPDSAGVFASWNPGNDWPEECGPVDMDCWGSHPLAHFLHPRMVAFPDRAVIVSRFGGLRQLVGQAQFVKRLGNQGGHVLVTLVVDARAHGGVER